MAKKKKIASKYLEGYEIIEIQTMADLRKTDSEWILESHDFDEVVGLYSDIGDFIKFKPIRTFGGKFLSIVHNRLYDDSFTGIKGNYIGAEKLENL